MLQEEDATRGVDERLEFRRVLFRSGVHLARLLGDALLLLARRWGPAETLVVKPSNILAGLMVPMMALRPDTKALLLHAPLPEFLLSVARKGLWCRLWARELLEGLIRENLVDRSEEHTSELQSLMRTSYAVF